jgi:hypothetical protein
MPRLFDGDSSCMSAHRLPYLAERPYSAKDPTPEVVTVILCITYQPGVQGGSTTDVTPDIVHTNHAMQRVPRLRPL